MEREIKSQLDATYKKPTSLGKTVNSGELRKDYHVIQKRGTTNGQP